MILMQAPLPAPARLLNRWAQYVPWTGIVADSIISNLPDNRLGRRTQRLYETLVLLVQEYLMSFSNVICGLHGAIDQSDKIEEPFK